MANDNQGKTMGQIITKAWADDTFKQRLLADATAVLREEGVPVPDGAEIRAVENSEKVFHIVIPPAPQALDDAALQSVAGGTNDWIKDRANCFVNWVVKYGHLLS